MHRGSKSKRACWSSLCRDRCVGFLLGLVSIHLTVAAAESQAPLRLGFSASVFEGVNEEDAKAAMKIWTQAILWEHGLSMPAEPHLLNGNEAIASAVHGKLVDAVTLTAQEYWALGRQFMATNAILGVSAGSVGEEYVLLVRRDGGIARIEGLKGRSVVFFQNPRACLAPVWLDTMLLQAGLGPTTQFCARLSYRAKLTQTVLPVFFGQTDACVVTRRGFQTMTELNPQLGHQLKILAASSPLVPVAFLFRADCDNPVMSRIIENIEKIHLTPAGQQVFTLFQCDRVEVRPTSALNPTLDLIETHARLAGSDSPIAAASTNSLIEARAAGNP